MNRKVFMLDKDEIGIFDETEYKEIEMMGARNESALQKCLERFPDLIPASQIDSENTLQFITVKSEAGVTAGSIDILLLDSNGVLNIVETKLYQNREIRRAVLGQALEYAAYLVMEWDTERIKEAGNNYWQTKKENFEEKVTCELLAGSEDKEVFWEKVQQNLDDMNIRIIVVADKVPKELRQVVEFVNENSKFEIFALEVRLFVNKDGKKVLVPYIYGTTERRQTKASSARNSWSHERLEEEMQEEENEVRRKRFLEMMEYCYEMDAFNDGFSKTPSFRMHNKDGQNVMTFSGNGTIFAGLHPDIFGGKENLDIFFERLEKMKMFGYKKSDYNHWKLSKGRIEELSDKDFQELKSIVKSVYNKRMT